MANNDSDLFWQGIDEEIDRYYQGKYGVKEEERQQGISDLRDIYRFGEFPEDTQTEQDLRDARYRPQFNQIKQQRIDALPGLELDEQDDISVQPSLLQRIAGPLERAYKNATGYKPKPSPYEQFQAPQEPLSNPLPLPSPSVERKTDEGRPIISNNDGTVSTERTITFEDPLNPGRWVNFPSLFNGKEESQDVVERIFRESGGYDPTTGKDWRKNYGSPNEAEAAAQSRSLELGQKYDGESTPNAQPPSGPSGEWLNALPFGGFLQSPEQQAERASELELSPAPRDPSELSSLSKGFARGLLSTGSQFTAGGAAIAKGLGFDETAERWMQTYDDLSKEAERFNGVQFAEAFDSPGKFISWAAGVLGEQIPVIASIMVSGGVGAVMGRVAAKGALGKTAQILSSEQARKVAKWSLRGAAASSGTAMSVLEGGGIYGEQREAGVEPNPAIALIGGSINGILETVVPLGLLKAMQAEQLAGPFMNDLMKRLGQSGILTRIAAMSSGTAASEGLTELLQEEVAIQARALVDEKYQRLSDEANARRAESLAAGALMGGLFGAAGGASLSSQEAGPIQQQGMAGNQPSGPTPLYRLDQPAPQRPLGPTPLYRLNDPLPPVDLPQARNLSPQEMPVQQENQILPPIPPQQYQEPIGPPQAAALQQEEVVPEDIKVIPPSLQPPMAARPEEDRPEEDGAREDSGGGPITLDPTVAPRHELSDQDNAELLLRAQKAKADMDIAGKERGFRMPVEVPGQGGTKEVISSKSPTAQWYKEATKGPGKLSRKRIEVALEKIEQDEGRDVGKDVQRVKELLLSDPEFMNSGFSPRNDEEWEQAIREAKGEQRHTESSVLPPVANQEQEFTLTPPELTKPPKEAKKTDDQKEMFGTGETLQVGVAPIIGRETTPEESPLFSKTAQEEQPTQNALPGIGQEGEAKPTEKAGKDTEKDEAFEFVKRVMNRRDNPPAIILREGERIETTSGRKTTPFPGGNVSSNANETKTLNAMDRWLLENALREAQARGDDFRAKVFQGELLRKGLVPRATKDDAKEYLFGKQPQVRDSILSDLSPLPSVKKDEEPITFEFHNLKGEKVDELQVPKDLPLPSANPETVTPKIVTIPSATATEQISKAQAEGQPVKIQHASPDRQRKVFIGKNGQRTIVFPSDLHAELFDFVGKLKKKIEGKTEFDTTHATSRLKEKLHLPSDTNIGELSSRYRQSVMDLAKAGKSDETIKAPDHTEFIHAESKKASSSPVLPSIKGAPEDSLSNVLPNVDETTLSEEEQRKPFGAKTTADLYGMEVQPKAGKNVPAGKIRHIKTQEGRIRVKTQEGSNLYFHLSDFEPSSKKEDVASQPDGRRQYVYTPPDPGAPRIESIESPDLQVRLDTEYRRGIIPHLKKGVPVTWTLRTPPLPGSTKPRTNRAYGKILKEPKPTDSHVEVGWTGYEGSKNFTPQIKSIPITRRLQLLDEEGTKANPVMPPVKTGQQESQAEEIPQKEEGNGQQSASTEPVRPSTRDTPEKVPAKGVSKSSEQQPTPLPPVKHSESSSATDEPTTGAGVQSRPGVRDRSQGTTVSSERKPAEKPDKPPTESSERITPEKEQSPAERAAADNPEAASPLFLYNYHIDDNDAIEEGGQKTKYRRNVDAIRLLKKLEVEGRNATPDEQATLVRYTGWGGLPQAFDLYHRDWGKEAKELKGLLTEEEWDAAKQSTQYAHYTSPGVIRGIWGGLSHLGFNGGRALEPGAGIGHFLGLAANFTAEQATTKWTAIEKDSLSGRFLKQLYQSANVNINPFEDTTLPNNFFDVVVGNVPFSDSKPHGTTDKELNRLRFSLHNYFFAKSIKKVRPGGVVAFITSRYTMDSEKNKQIRSYISEQANLIAAIRLPNNAFKGIANTEVTTDVLFLQKREPGTPYAGLPWKNVKATNLKSSTGESMIINEHFADNPRMMLGKMAFTGSLYRANEPTLEPDGRDLESSIKELLQELPSGLIPPHRAPRSTTPEGALDSLPAPGDVKPEAFVVKDGQLYINHEGQLEHQPNTSSTTIQRIAGLIEIRDTRREVVRTQLEDDTDEAIEKARKDLNKVYDRFVKKHGPINQSGNRLAYQADPDWPVLATLEKWDSKTKKADKEAIFFKRTIVPSTAATKADGAKDGLLISLNELGRFDLPRVMELTGKSKTEVLEELGPLVFENPEGGWEHAEGYLSGNVKHKLRIAEEAAKTDSKYARNVESLKAVIPEDLAPSQITVRFGVGWVPEEDVRQFVYETLDMNTKPTIKYMPELGYWSIGNITNRISFGSDKILQYSTARTRLEEIIDATMNSQSISVYDTTPRGSSLNEKDTFAAREMQKKWRDEFQRWIWGEPIRAKRLAKRYNDEFNAVVVRKFDGDHLTLPGSNPGIVLRSSQKSGIWRVLQSGNTLLGHEVGTGKTFTVIGAAMESRRIGLSKKPVIVVPKHLVEMWRNEFVRLYPSANVLMPSVKDFHKDNRRKLIARMANGDWDAIVISHTMLSRIPVSVETERAYVQEQVAILEDFIKEEQAEKGGDPRAKKRTIKQMEKAKEKLESRIKARMDNPTDEGMTFEETGIDMLMVDEAHEFKNLFFPTRMTRIAGLSSTGSKRSTDLYLKARYLSKLNNNRNVVFATGTPISNTLAEAFTMQRYLQQDQLSSMGMEYFDAWARHFGEEVTAPELSPAGKWRIATRFAKFVNLPDLMKVFGQVMDVRFAEDVGVVRPPLRTGKPINITAKPSQALKDYMQRLIERAEHLPSDPSIDNMLKVSTDGRHAALDIRLRVPGLPDDPNSKVNIAIRKIVEEYKAFSKYKGTQLVFLDLSTPKGKADSAERKDEADDDRTTEAQESQEADTDEEIQVRENVYSDIRAKLIKQGVKPEHIAFIHDADTDAKKTTLYAHMNSGEVRILIGTTRKMGVGMNVQERLIALHNIDPPWKPSELEQRNGRILRQGNRLLDEIDGFEVAIYNYATEAPSFDVRMWQILESKAKMVGQVMRYDPNIREMEDMDVQTLSIAEMKAIATGNPVIMEKIGLDAEEMRLSALERHHRDAVHNAKYEVSYATSMIKSLTEDLEQLKSYQEILDANPIGDSFAIEIDGKTYADRPKAGEAIANMIPKVHASGKARTDKDGKIHSVAIGTYRGMRVVMSEVGETGFKDEAGNMTIAFTVSVMPAGSATGKFLIYGHATTGSGAISSLERAVNKTHERTHVLIPKQIEDWGRKKETHEKIAKSPFEQAADLKRVKSRLGEIEKIIHQSIKEQPSSPTPPRELQNGDETDIEELGSPDDGEILGMARKGRKLYAGPTPRIPVLPIPGEKPTPLRQILMEASKGLDQKIWKAKVPRGLDGVYVPKNKTVLFKYANDLDAAAHELAHAIDRKFNLLGPQATTNSFNFELSKFWQHGSVAKSGPRSRLAYKKSEGVAEWMRAWLVNPQKARQEAPLFTAHALSRIPKEVIAELESFGRKIRVFAGSAGAEQIKANIAQVMPLPSLKNRLLGETEGPGFQTTWKDRMAAKFTDDLAPVLSAFEWARKQRGEADAPLLPKDDPRVLARLFMGMNSEMDDVVQYGMPIANKPFDQRATGGGYTWLLEPIPHGSIEELERGRMDVAAYMIAQRTIEKANQLQRAEHISGIGGGIADDVSVARRTIQELTADPRKKQWLDEAATRYREWADANLRYQVDMGRMSQEQYDLIKDNNEYYVAMQRVVEITPGEEMVVVLPESLMGRHAKIGSKRNTIHKFKGSDLSIKDPYPELLKASAQALREADRNNILRAFTEIMENDNPQLGTPDVDLGSIARKAKEGEKHTIPVFTDGNKEVWQFHPDVYKALKGLVDGPTRLPRAITILPKILRNSIIYAPTFAAKNPIRDAFHRAVISNNKSKPWDSLKNYSPMEISQLKRYGGDQAGHYYNDEEQYTKAMKAAMEELAGKKGNIVVLGHKLGRKYLNLIEMSERQGRLAEYRRAFKLATTEGVDIGDGRKTVLDEYNAGLYAAKEARGLIDYAVSGEYLRWINQIVPFSNAAIQGLKVVATHGLKAPARTFTAMTAYAITPAILTLLFALATGEEEEYRQQPPWIRDLFYNFKIGPDLWLRIPKPFEIGVLSTTFERAVDYYVFNNDAAFDGHVGQFIETLLPVDTAALAGPLQGIIQAAFNWDAFRQKHIVPIHEENKELGLRSTWRASRLGQVIQELIGMDARQVDFLVKQQFGYFGQYATRLSDVGRSERQSLGLGETGFFVSSPAQFSQDATWVQKRARERGATSTREYKAFNDLIDNYYKAKTSEQKDAAARIIRRHAKDLRRKWERTPPRPDAEKKFKEKRMKEGRPDPFLRSLGIQ